MGISLAMQQLPEVTRPTPVPAPPPSRAWSTLEHAGYVALLAMLYYGVARFGLRLAFINASATAVWPASGIALAALLLFGRRIWPGIFIGAFLVNLATAGTVATSFGIAIGNTLEGLAGAYLVNRFAGGRQAFDRPPDIVRFVLLAGLVATTISATVGVTTLALGGLAEWSAYGFVWLTWWLGDAGGNIVVAPALLLWIANPRLRLTRLRAAEALMLFGTLCLVGMAVFGSFSRTALSGYPLEFVCTPFLVWAAYRFGQREAAAAVLVLASIATWGTVSGYGPFWRNAPNESLLLLQAFNVVNTLMSLVLAAVVREREHAADRLRRLAVTDPLTGLANYRQLMEVLETEIHRSQRTDRPFAILFLDLDDLKRINDRHGHVIGSRALLRVARALRSQSRAIDTPARFGGDEFALVLPESDETAARHVAERISAQLTTDGLDPVLSVSIGVAVHPRDGHSAEALLASADALLYDMKAAAHR